MTKNKLVLVFPPLTVPTSPPLGVALLKAYIERELLDWQVVMFDLNVWLFNYFLQKGQFRNILNNNHFPEGALAEIVLEKVSEVFRDSNHETEFYEAPERYNVYADLLSRFTSNYAQELAGFCRDYDVTGIVHPLIDAMIEKIVAESPDCVGVSMIFSDQVPIGITIGRILKKKYGLTVVFGGSVFTGSPETFLAKYPDSADMVISGEGEDALRQYLTELNAPEKVRGGVYFHDGVVCGSEPVLRSDLDHFPPPDFSDVDLRSYYSPQPVIPLLLSRGCYWRRCTFCVHYHSAGMKYRMHSVDYIINMLRHFSEQGIRYFAFIDEMISPHFFRKLAYAIVAAKLDIAYYALSRPEKGFSRDLLALMADSGCKYILWGLESASQRVLDLMDKGTNIVEVKSVLRNANAAGIANHVYVICGFPTETAADFAETVKFLIEMRECIYGVHRGTFVLQKNTPVYDLPQKFSITRLGMPDEEVMGGRCDYECASGMSPMRAKEIFHSVQPVFRSFNPYAQRLTNFRDHALLIYDRFGSQLKPELRAFPHIVFPENIS